MREFKEIIERALNYYIHITSGELKFLKNQGEDTGHLEEHLSQANSALNYIKNFNIEMPKNKWIKVPDRLPEKDGKYIVYTKLFEPFIVIADYYKDGIYMDEPFSCPDESGKFTIHKKFRKGFMIKWKPYPESLPKYEACLRIDADYWMPLPEPPEEV